MSWASFAPYLLVALGSALGGVARYGVGLAAAAAWGDAFPWGTILINVAGSFVIGYFAALTAAGGAMPAGPNLRIFVMVGLCGGFTTFSSFSLQNIELLRGGQALAAFANIAISVVATLMAVAGGYSLALHTPATHRPAAQAATPEPTQILAVLNRVETAEPVLVAADLLARRLEGSEATGISPGRVEVLHVRPGDPWEFLPTEEIMTEGRRREMRAEVEGRATALKAIYESWQAGRPAGAANWLDEAGTGAAALAWHTTNAKAIVFGRSEAASGHWGGGEAEAAVRAALVQAEAPVLLVSAKRPERLGETIAVAWSPDGSAGAAVESALPLLATADRVVLLMAQEGREQPADFGRPLAYLNRAGVPVDIRHFGLKGADIGPVLLAQAEAAGADLLIMGAFSHNRLREALFGGATAGVLAETGPGAEIPILFHG